MPTTAQPGSMEYLQYELGRKQAQDAQSSKESEESKRARIAQERLSQAQAAREADMAKGRARGQELFGEGALGRVQQDRAGEVSDIIAQRKAQAQGFTPDEQQSMRDNNMRSIQQNQAAALRAQQMNMARSGVRGAVASNQLGSMQRGLQGQLADQERNLFLENINQRRQGLGALEQSTQGARADELARQQYNQAQMGREKAGQLSTEMGMAGLGAGERSAVMQQLSAEQGADAQRKIAEANKGKK